MAIHGQAVQVNFVDRVSEIDEALWRACFPENIEGHFWYRALETCGLEGQFSFFYAVISCAGVRVGIAPCFLYDVPISLVAPGPVAFLLGVISRAFPRVGYQRTLFIGSPCSDEGTIGLVSGVVLADVVTELCEGIRNRARCLNAPMIVFKDFPAAALSGLTDLTDFFPTVSYPGTVLDLPGSQREVLLRSWSHNQRHNFLKKLRRSREILPLATSVVKRPTDAELSEIFGLFMQTYSRGKTKFERLGPQFFDRIRETQPAEFILQRDPSGALVAFMLVFSLGDRLVNKFIGLDYHRGGKVYLYFRLFDAAIDLAYSRGARELQSGQTGYRAKLDLGHRLVPLFNVVRHENRIVHAIYRAVGKRISWSSLDSDLQRCPYPQ